MGSSFKLLTVGNPKIEKSKKYGYLTAVLHLAPANLSGYEVCAKATPGCRAACLNTAGRGGIMAGLGILTYDAIVAGARNTIQAARIRRTRWYFEDRPAFLAVLCADIERVVRLAAKHGLKPAIRLNGTSDIPWERVKLPSGRTVFDVFPDVQFYDYTKRTNRTALPANYHLTLSLAEDNDADAVAWLRAGGNVAAVFDPRKCDPQFGCRIPGGYSFSPKHNPEWPATFRVIDGDEHDLRFLDPKGVIVGLKAKGNAKRDTSGFVR